VDCIRIRPGVPAANAPGLPAESVKEAV
jgi:hypothetical protein